MFNHQCCPLCGLPIERKVKSIKIKPRGKYKSLIYHEACIERNRAENAKYIFNLTQTKGATDVKKKEVGNGQERKPDTLQTWDVSRVRQIERKDGGSIVLFSLILNGVTVNNVRVGEGKNGDFISLPQYKGNDGKYYSHVYFRFSEDDRSSILAEVERQLNE